MIRPAAVLCSMALAIAMAGATRGASAADGRPRLDVRHARTRGRAVVAPLRGGGTAELTLDPALQKEAERLLAGAGAHEGAIVISDVRTGRILAWASRGGATDQVATPGAPSASVFKVVTAAALLESGRVGRGTKQCYTGGERRIDAADFEDDRSRDDRCTTLGEALGHSVNLVFARLAKKHLSPPELRDMAEQLGIGEKIPIDVAVPASSLRIPTDELGFARAAAGFSDGRLSALSALFLMQTIANRGERVPLAVLASTEPHGSAGRALSTSTAEQLTRMLEVTTSRGTSAKVFHEKGRDSALARVRVAGKTGTLVRGRPRRMYSWFAGFAPSRKPEVAITVLLANDVRWWAKANAVAREMLEAYFERAAGRGT